MNIPFIRDREFVIYTPEINIQKCAQVISSNDLSHLVLRTESDGVIVTNSNHVSPYYLRNLCQKTV